MTVLLTLHAAAKLTSSGSTVRSTLPSWTTSGALVVDMGILPRDDAGDQRRFGGGRLTADVGFALSSSGLAALLPDGLCAVELYTRRESKNR